MSGFFNAIFIIVIIYYMNLFISQEEPLPHELRPVPGLKMTMDYLATNIMDLVEGREEEWFDFVWNRTRGIRKVHINSDLFIYLHTYLFMNVLLCNIILVPI